MSAQICADCTAAYSVGAPRCPQCGANNPRSDVDAPGVPTLTVRCPGLDCPAYGALRVVQLRLAGPGVVERPALHCMECDRHVETVTEEEQNVPKTTVHGGASDATFDEEGEQSSPTPEAGTPSSTSSPKPSTSPEKSESDLPKPARTTASRSKKVPTGSSSATGTGGAPAAGTSETGSDGDEG